MLGMFGEFLTYPVYALTPCILDGGGGAYCLFVHLLLQQENGGERNDRSI